ncbi:non-ribosomal peptide synthetase [Legionella cincinnatiensis]|nr:non-ribosomal peptide synthetase [Legionella cincinnatiensis]
MKILKVLINLKINKLVQSFIDYLIDAGHFVFVNAHWVEMQATWIDKYTHNFRVVSEDQLEQLNVNYELHLMGTSKGLKNESIILDFELTTDQINLFSFIGKNNAQKQVVNKQIINPYHQQDPNFLPYINRELTEVFIDTIIHLSKYGENELTPVARVPKANQFVALQTYEYELVALNQYYQSVQGNEDVFLIDAHPQKIKAARSSQCCHLPQKDYLELFTLYLLQLFNSRKDGIYTYDLLIASNKLTKFVPCYFNDDYCSLQSHYQDPRYEVIHNKFYAVTPSTHSSVLVSFDEKSQEHDAVVSIHYDSQLAQITVSYPQHLHFFASLPQIVDQFLAGLDSFMQGRMRLGHFQQLASASWLMPQNTQKTFPQTLIHQLFEQQAALLPHNVAVSCGEIYLTYNELNEQANQLAAWIHTQGIAENQLIVLYMERKVDLVVAVLAVLKSGNAYVPLDLKYPNERVATIIEDCQPALILTHGCYYEKLKQITPTTPLLALDAPDIRAQLCSFSQENLEPCNDVTHLAYVIYTSGTTGKPKGVMIEHRALVNTISYFAETVKFSATDKLLAVTTIAFDIAGLELYMPLICGGEIILARQQEVMDAPRLLQIIEEKQITVMQATPSLWHLVVQALGDKTLAIRALCGGEALNEVLATALMQKVSFLWNVYGPTETTIWSTINLCRETNNPSFIGKPIANTECYVLDEHLLPLPVGVIGELYIGGAGLARGYWCREELTTQQFLYHSFTDSSQAFRLYKTGDLVRWTSAGELEFLGRNDFQVKIRGHRIELGDIESALNEFAGVQQSVVAVKTMQDEEQASQINHYLVGYYVAPSCIDEEAILVHLAKKIPDYMMPNMLMRLEGIPLNPNGKVDRKALPIPNFNSSAFMAPRNELEIKLCAIWAKVLGLPVTRANILDDFFRLGGNSILAIQLVNKINHELHSDIAIRDVFIEKNIANLAHRVEQSLGRFIYKEYQVQPMDKSNLYQPFPLNNVQQTYYWGRFDHFELSNISTHVYTEFKYIGLDVERLQNAFNQLIQRHLALRTVFIEDQQCFLEEVTPYAIAYFELSTEAELLAIRQQFSHKVYSPDTYPLFDVFVTKFNGIYLLHVSFDAIIIDMSSFEILFTEWITLYEHPEHRFPTLQLNFRDYILQSERLRASLLFEHAQVYWQKRLDDYYLEMNLPLIARPSQVKYPHFQRISKIIPKLIWDKLTAKAHHIGVSLTALVLEAYARTLCFWSGQKQVAVNLTLFNRLPLHPQVNDLIGDFTALELFAYQYNTLETVNSVLEKTHQQLLTDLEHNLFDGIDFQRMLRQHHSIPSDTILSPIVLTSVLGGANQSSLFHLPMNSSYQGIHYAISQTSQVWLDNKAYETHEGFIAEWDYVEQLFAPQTIQAMHETYCQLIEALALTDWEHDVFPAAVLPKLHTQLINEANQYPRAFSEETLVSAYERSLEVAGCSELIAVIDAGKKAEYSHGELWSASEQVVASLLATGSQGRLIAVLSEKGYSQVVATLSIMKAGYAYLPLHVDWPLGRVHEVLKQGGVELVLVSRKMAAHEETYASLVNEYEVLIIEDALEHAVDLGLEKPKVHADDVAYVIFTSGSTGKPKGVTISHRGALNTIEAVNEHFGVSSKDKVLALSELSFDLSVYDIYGLLLAGGCIVFPEQEQTKEPKHWLSLIETHQISLWNTVPQLAGLLVDEAEGPLPSLRTFLLSGDWIPVSLPKKLKASCPEATVMSLGGATEGSIWSIWYPIEEVNPNWSSIPYGVAMPNQHMYVLNQDGAHCPVGVMGEIHIGGMGVALNYWGDEEITQRQFFTHPQLGKVYRTGDLGRWHEDGYMEFCGRNDFQVKINGYRVELDEITAKIEQIKGVEKAVVALQKHEGKTHLVAYLLPENRKQESSLDKDLFKLEQRGLLANKHISYQLPQPILVTHPNRRKSYRNFISTPIDSTLVQKIGNSSLMMQAECKYRLAPIDIQSLMRVLASIAGQQVANRALPKYQYPSGGSSYSVRCFVNVPDKLQDLEQGLFYYHPLKQALCATDLMSSADDIEFHFVVHWPAIQPLYADLSKKLAYIELGHMLHLMLSSLLVEGFSYALSIEDKVLDSDNHLLAKVKLTQEKAFFPCFSLGLKYLSNQNQSYVDETQNSVLSLRDFSIFTQSSEFGQLLRASQLMITAEGDDSWQNYLMAGYSFQAISQSLYAHNIGSCTLGFTPYAGALYAMVLGSIEAQEQEKPESAPPLISLEQLMNQELSHSLPDYMLPHAYALLDVLPLSANGKLAKNQLPEITIKHEYQAPETEFEWQMASIWAKILSLSPSSIGRVDNFFALGGNSLLAMQLVRQLNRELKLNMKLTDLYQYSTLRDIARNFSPAQEEVREEGVI